MSGPGGKWRPDAGAGTIGRRPDDGGQKVARGVCFGRSSVQEGAGRIVVLGNWPNRFKSYAEGRGAIPAPHGSSFRDLHTRESESAVGRAASTGTYPPRPALGGHERANAREPRPDDRRIPCRR